MKQIIIVLALLCQFLSTAQNTVAYRTCTNCPTGENTSNINTTYSYGALTPYNSADVTSDFGARYPGAKYDWHKGVDYRPKDCSGMDGCRGISITSIEAGAVADIYALHGMKMVAVVGDNGHHYGYGHIFNSRFVGQNSTHQYINEGKFFIKHLEEYPVDKIYAIVDLTNDIAFGSVEGTVTIDVGNYQRSIQVVTAVSAGQDIAPMGGSCCSFYNGTGSENDALPVHLHLYQFRDINAGNLVSESHETNCMNPLQSVAHQSPSIEAKWQTEGQATWNNPIINPIGTLPTRFRVRSLMTGVTNPSGQSISETGKANRYGNVVSNINKVEVEIKKAVGTTYKPYKGLKYEGLINLGGTTGTTLYPTELTKDKRNGKWDRQGIDAYAYDDYQGYPYDDYYFEGFFSRIRKTTDKLTDVPQNALYNDDRYKLRAKVTNVIGDVFYSDEKSYILDNFLPYLTEVNIKYNGDPLHQTSRVGDEGSAKADDGYITNQIHEYPLKNGLFLPNIITIVVKTSYPMENVRMAYVKEPLTIFSSKVNMSQDITDRYKWTGSISTTFGTDDCFKVRFSGQDLSGNELMNIYHNTDGNAISQTVHIPTRKGAGTGSSGWNHLPTGGAYDQIDFCVKNCDYRIWPNESMSFICTT